MGERNLFRTGSRRHGARKTLGLLATALALACGLAATAAGEPVKFDIKAQAVGPALRAFGEQAKVQVFYPEDQVAGIKTAGLKGSFEIETGLKELLKGTGLGFEKTDAKTFVIVREAGASADGPAARFSKDVIVTASKREEEVREVAASVTPITAEVMEQKGAESFADFLAAQPGVSFNQSTPGLSQIAIRGVATTAFIDQGQQSTGYYFNDIPMTEPYFSVGVPDLDTFDVERVEVLRGPQGTLFGSATLGGAVNYIPKGPRADAFEGRVEVGASSTTHTSGVNYGLKGMFNVPLMKERLALRVVASTRAEPGYLDNIGVGKEGSTDLTVSGVRGELEWRPTDRLTLTGLGLYSKTDNKDRPSRYTDLGEWERTTAVLEPFSLATTVYSLRGQYNWDSASLTVNAAHTDKQQHSVSDITPYFGALLGGLVPYVAGPQDAFARGDVFEARLASLTAGRFDWLVGASYSHYEEDFPSAFGGPGVTEAIETIYGPIFGAGIGEAVAPNDVLQSFGLPIDGKETALFGEATWRFTDKWRVTAGGRYYDTTIDTTNEQFGFLTFLSSGNPSDVKQSSQNENGFTPKFSIAFAPDRDTLFYALVSQGFRFGGANLAPPNPQYPTPATFGSDSLVNYEIGVRLAWMNRRLTLDVTPYYIDWSDIQLRQGRPDGFAYAINAGKARNMGVEVAVHAEPTPGLSLDAATGYLDATLREDVFNEFGGQTLVKAGTTLPMAAKWNVMASATYAWKSSLAPSVTASYRYVGSAPADLAASGTVGNYSLYDLRARLTALGIQCEAFGENLTDTRGVTTGSFAYPPSYVAYVRPRTIGVRLIYDLK
jgi:outer membrane receptor protein involved in Fe transport